MKLLFSTIVAAALSLSSANAIDALWEFPGDKDSKTAHE